MDAADFEKVVVNGVELTVSSSLAALRSGCSLYGISQSGGKQKCYRRLVNHLKKLELELLANAAQHAVADAERVPKSPSLATPPSLELQRQHELTHTPYQPWCESCVCFKARADRQCRNDSARISGTATVSFDLAYTRSIPEGANQQGITALPFLVMVDSSTGYVGCVPLRSKGQLELMTREILSFPPGLGHSEVIYRCDNEPTMRQLKYVVSTRLSMGLPTRSVTPPAYFTWKLFGGKCNWKASTTGMHFDAYCEAAYRFGDVNKRCLVELGPPTCSIADEPLWCGTWSNTV